MIRLIGKKGCSRCEITKQILKKKGVEFNYELISELSNEEQELLNKMVQETGLMQMPLILKDGILTEIKEI